MNHEDKSFLFFIVLSKVFYMIIALLVFSKLTSLGDTAAYLEGQFSDRNNVFSFAYLMSFLGAGLGFYSHIFSALISCFALFYLIAKSKLIYKEKCFIILLCFFPSFGVWTSVFTKESFVLFFSCVSAVYVIELIYNRRIKPSLFQFIVLSAFLIYKPQYALPFLLAIFYFLSFRNVVNAYSLMSLNILIMALLLLAVPFTLSFTGYLVEEMPKHFSLDSSSTRYNDFWLVGLDFYRYLPEGIFISFVGPTLSEALDNVRLMPFFIEGLLLYCMLFYFIIKFLFINLRRFNILVFSMLLLIVLGVLICHYPFGIFNPGSATRYRSGFVIPLFVIVLAFISRNRVKSI